MLFNAEEVAAAAPCASGIPGNESASDRGAGDMAAGSPSVQVLLNNLNITHD